MSSHFKTNHAIRDLFTRLFVDDTLDLEAEDRAWVKHFVEHNELEIAFDEMLAIMHTQGIEVNPEQFQTIGGLGKMLAADATRWSTLRRKA